MLSQANHDLTLTTFWKATATTYQHMLPWTETFVWIEGITYYYYCCVSFPSRQCPNTSVLVEELGNQWIGREWTNIYVHWQWVSPGYHYERTCPGKQINRFFYVCISLLDLPRAETVSAISWGSFSNPTKVRTFLMGHRGLELTVGPLIF